MLKVNGKDIRTGWVSSKSLRFSSEIPDFPSLSVLRIQVNNGSTRTMYEIRLKLKKTTERYQWSRSDVFIDKF